MKQTLVETGPGETFEVRDSPRSRRIAPDLINTRPVENKVRDYIPLKKQVGGNHYQKFEIQPIEYILANNLGWCEANIIKLVSRHPDKGGVEDLQKAIHFCELAIDHYYNKKD